MKRPDWFLVALWTILVIAAALWVAPFVFILLTSLKTEAEIYATTVFALPAHPAWSNYAQAWGRGNFAATFLNSVIITCIKVPLGLLLSAMAAYALAQMRIPGRNTVFLAILFGTMIPFQVLLAPLFSLVNSLGLINTYVGVILPYIAFGVPYQVFVLRGFFRHVPKEMTEAALLDGANHLTIFWRIFLPLSLPALAALVILDFVATWNEFAMALVILQDSGRWTLPLGLMSFQGQFASAYGQLNAAIVMTVLPAAIVYLIFQRYFIGGLTAGAVKE
ncbi:carbohydrate ABC transporter permease [Lichenicoccus roseus]|uniref:Carbohydrate ABC transporter permease n=1 Tax=Lichenicoccus roseus TaxID=2683649 RepID=A0A5R9J3P8_9PROT|nr:carbohydrate ABC transporter permease [Lichenicoccus roseus]TLU72240.1 carbohydrate ABC transporter permease [Lichenicoccus roseus]